MMSSSLNSLSKIIKKFIFYKKSNSDNQTELERYIFTQEELKPFSVLYKKQLLKIRKKKFDNKLIVMLVISALRIDPRVERAARALVQNGYQVIVIAPDLNNPTLKESPINWGPNITFDILEPHSASFISEPPWVISPILLESALKYRPLAFHCHDLNTALIGLTAAKQIGNKCICDFHEWYSENVSWDDSIKQWVPHPEDKKKIYQSAESLVMRQADEVITVCDSIANSLEQQYANFSRKVHVIKNIPALTASEKIFPSIRETLNIDKNKLIILWQGGTGPTRLLEPVIESLSFSKEIVLIIRGPSLDLFGDGYLNLAKKLGVANKLFLLPPVKSIDTVSAAKQGDVGIWTLPNLSKNFYYALPNKIFEYLAAGLPLVCANFPEVKAIIDKYQVGSVFDPYDPTSISKAMEKFLEPAFYSKCRNNITTALSDIKADKEWNKLIQLYNKIQVR